MNKPKAQGTRWESEFVQQAQDAGLIAERLPEGGSYDCGDVWIVAPPSRTEPDISIVAWSRLVDNGTGRRVPDGARSVVVLSTDDFFSLVRQSDDFGFVAECKATERLNVTRTLDQAQKKLRRWKER